MKQLKKYFVTEKQSIPVDGILLVIRLFVGYAFIMHGWGKIQNPMDWMGADAPVPGILQALAALAEFGGGIALILGLVTRLAMLGLSITILVAVIMHTFVMGDPLVSLSGGRSGELAAVYLLISALLLIMGPGRYSLDKKIFG